MEKSWQEIQRKTNTVFFRLSAKGIIVSLTENFYDLTGVDEKSILGKQVLRFLTPDLQNKWKANTFNFPENGRPSEFFASISLNELLPRLNAYVNLICNPGGDFSGSATLINNRVQNDEMAFKQQEIIRSTLQSIDDLVFVADSKGVFTECYSGNQDSSVYFSSDLFVGNSFEEVGFPAEVSGKFFASLQQVKKTGKTQQIQYSLKVFGSEFFYQAKLSPRFDNSGDFEGVTAICRDITSLKKIEKQLTDSRDFYLTILQKFPTLVWRSGKEGACDFFNDTWLEFTGSNLDSQLGFGWVDNVHPHDRQQVKDSFLSAIGRRETFLKEYRLMHHTGEYRWVVDIGQPVYSPQNVFTGYIGSCTDIHQEKTNRRLLIESEERYRNIVELHSDLVSRWMPDGTLTFVNQPFCNLFGKIPSLLLGINFDQLFPEKKQRELKVFRDYISQHPSTQVMEQQVMDQQGQSHWIQWVSSPILDGGGKVVEFQSVGRDITRRIQEEEEKEKLVQSLNRRVKELTFLNDFSSVIHQQFHSLNNVLTYLVEMIPGVFSDMGKAFARISYNGMVFKANDFRIEPDFIKESFGKAAHQSGTIELFVDFSKQNPVGKGILLSEVHTYLSIIRDVLETFVNQYEAESLLKTTKQKYLELFESITDIVFVMDRRGHFTSINPAMQNILGYGVSENLFYQNMVVPSSMPAIEKAFESATEQKRNSVTFEADILTIHGEIKNFLINCLIKYKDDGLHEILGVARDVSESRQMSRKLIKAIVETEERERKRFAEELHDGLGPLLSGIKMYLQKADASSHLDTKDRKILSYCTQLTSEAIGQTRIIANNLMPNVLADFGLIKALNGFANKINELGKINVNVSSNKENLDLQPVESLVVYRVLTELINNALKHSNADNIDIDLTLTRNILKIIYYENGTTFHPQEVIQHHENKGMGLKNIINRVKSINGIIEFNMGNKEGFLVRVLFASGGGIA